MCSWSVLNVLWEFKRCKKWEEKRYLKNVEARARILGQKTRKPLKFGQKGHKTNAQGAVRKRCTYSAQLLSTFQRIGAVRALYKSALRTAPLVLQCLPAARTVTETGITFYRNIGIVIRKNRWKVDSWGFQKIGSMKPISIWGERYGPRNIGVLHKSFPFQPF